MWPFSKSKNPQPFPPFPDRQYVYLMYCPMTTLFKIGISSNPERRLRQIENASGLPVQLMAVWTVYDASTTEKVLHKYFTDRRHEGEWFNLSEEDRYVLGQVMGQSVTLAGQA
jgi:hypothetical protein